MNREDIIRMSQEAGALVSTPFDVWRDRFAKLVAAHEREACARVCEETEVVHEKWCVELYDNGGETLMEAAKAIRARGQ